MSGKRRSKAQLIRDRRKEADLYLEGWLQADIADELGIDQATVSRDLQAIQDEWSQSTLMDFNEAKARELAKIDKLEREYYAGWRRSCEDEETTKQATKGKVVKRKDEEGELVSERPAEVTRTRKGQAGDPRFLAGVERCIEMRCKIIGVNAPEKHEVAVYDLDAWRKRQEEQRRQWDDAQPVTDEGED